MRTYFDFINNVFIHAESAERPLVFIATMLCMEQSK